MPLLSFNKAVNNVDQAVLEALTLLAGTDQYQLKASLLLKTLIHITYEQLEDDQPTHTTKAYNTFQHALNHISYNFNKPINRESVAAELRITPQHLSRLFKSYSETNFNVTLKKMRLHFAMELVQSGFYSVNEIAERSGFINTGYFIKEFKKMFNSTPGKCL